jgi:TolB protein
MTKLNARHDSRLRASLVAVALATVAALPASANATFEGTSGPIAFQRISDLENGDSADIFRVAPRTGKARQLTDFPGFSWFADYSPNGNRIAFTRTDFEAEGAADVLYTMKADGSHPVRLASDCSGECLGDFSSAWAPNGRRIVFSRAFGPLVDDSADRVELHIAKADGRRDRTVPLDLPGKEPLDAQWSPDGKRLAVNMLNVGSEPEASSAIYVFRPDGTHLRRITPQSLNAGGPDWSPSGKRIVFNSSYEAQAAADIYTVRPDGSHLRLVHAAPPDQFAFAAVFSPSGKRIAFTQTGDEGLPHIHTMRRNGTRVRQITHGPVVDLQPDWGARR